MEEPNNTLRHFPIMIAASFVLFFLVIRLVIGKEAFKSQFSKVFILSVLIIVVEMLFGKYGEKWGLPWWIYYPVPC